MVYGYVMKAFEDSALPIIEQFYSDHEVYSFVLETHQRIAQAIADKNSTEAETQMRLLLEHGEKIIFEVIKRRK